jgi:CRP-like cAMP-binding protein
VEDGVVERERWRIGGDLRPVNALLRSTPPHELRGILPHLEPYVLERRRFLLPAGEPLRHVYLPESGLVSLRVGVSSGDTVEVANVGCEGLLGVSVLLEGEPPPYDMVCVVSGRAVRIAAGRFLEFSQQLPGFRRALLRYAAALLFQVARTAACNRLHSVEQRLARWLLQCSDRVGSTDFTLTHEGLAAMLGTQRPFLSQTLGDFERMHLIQNARSHIRVVDRTGLESLACEDYETTRTEYSRLLTG